MTSSSASEASLAASTSQGRAGGRQGRQEDAEESACPTLTSRQPLAKPPRRLSLCLAIPAGHVSSPQDAATSPKAGSQGARLPVAASLLLDSSSEPGEQPQGYLRGCLTLLGEPHSSARNGSATVSTYGLVIKS